MRISAPLLTLAGTVAGTVAAVAAYQSAAGPSDTTPASSTTTETPAPVTSTSWLPCEKGWRLKGETCVRIKEKVVVVADLPAPAAPQAQVATRSSDDDHSAARGDDHEAEHGDDHEAEDSDSHEVEHEDEADHEDVGDDD